MAKLLRAGFFRLWRSRIFWGELGITAVLACFICLANYSSAVQATANRLALEDVFFTMNQLIGLFLAAGISLLVGTEYADGTIRNKLLSGNTRGQVYAASGIISAVFSVLVVAVDGLITYGLGRFLFGNFQIPPSQVAVSLGNTFLSAVVYAALFVLIAMNCSNRSVAAVASLLLAVGMLSAGGYLGGVLMEPEETYDYLITTENGTVYGDLMKNPAYIGGLQRTVYEWLYDLLPTGQLLQIYFQDFSRCARWAVVSIFETVCLTAVGFLAFRRKDLK